MSVHITQFCTSVFVLAVLQVGPGLWEVDCLPPSANRDLTNGSGSNSSMSGPLTLTNIKLDNVSTFRQFRWSVAMLFIREKPRSHSADEAGYVWRMAISWLYSFPPCFPSFKSQNCCTTVFAGKLNFCIVALLIHHQRVDGCRHLATALDPWQLGPSLAYVIAQWIAASASLQ